AGATLNGTVGSDSVLIDSTGYSASFATKAVANAKPVTVLGVALSGADAGNYSVTQPTGLTAKITPAELTVSATADDKVYDGTTAAVAHLTTDKVSGDAVTVDYTSAAFGTKSVGDPKT